MINAQNPQIRAVLTNEQDLTALKSDLEKTQKLVHAWQLAVLEQDVRQNFGVLGRTFSCRIATLEPLRQALAAGRSLLQRRDVFLANEVTLPLDMKLFLLEHQGDFNRFQSLLGAEVDLVIMWQREWNSSPLVQYFCNKEEAVMSTAAALELSKEGQNWDCVGRLEVNVPSPAEEAYEDNLSRTANWNMYTRVGFNMSVTALVVAGAVFWGANKLLSK